MFKSKNKLCYIFFIFLIILSASCTNKLSSVNTNPEKGYEIIQTENALNRWCEEILKHILPLMVYKIHHSTMN